MNPTNGQAYLKKESASHQSDRFRFFVREVLVIFWNFPSHLGANALEASLAAVSKYGGARAGYRTMLDALIPACTTLKEARCTL
jgi:DAK2 domain